MACVARGSLTYANQKVFDLTGYTREDFEKGLNSQQFVIPEDRPQVVANMKRVLAGEELRGNEYMGLRKDGSTFPVLVFSARRKQDGIRSIIVDNTEQKEARLRSQSLVEELQVALAEIKTLHGIIPICAHCKGIRDDEGCYHRLETYITKHTGALFTHGVCPDCQEKLYGKRYTDQ